MRRFAALAMLSLAACAPTVCDRTGDWAESCGLTWTDADQQVCSDQRKVCDADEKKALEAYYDCLEERGFFTCRTDGTATTGGFGPGFEDVVACDPELDGVNPDCKLTIGITGGTFVGAPEP